MVTDDAISLSIVGKIMENTLFFSRGLMFEVHIMASAAGTFFMEALRWNQYVRSFGWWRLVRGMP